MSDVTIEYLLKLQTDMDKRLSEVEGDAKDLQKQLARLDKRSKDNTKSTKAFGIAAKGATVALTALAAGAAAVGTAYLVLGKNAIKTTAGLEKFEAQLGILLGGLEKGKARVEELFEISSRTPFSINGLVEAEARLEAFGVNAEVVRGGVLDLAGATGMDLVEAANAVGKALAGGAGAADQLRDRGVLGMVEVTAGVKTAEMSIDEFREALVETLKTNDKIAGGTEVLAETFSGLFSTLGDQFTAFNKAVGDAGLFEAAKETLKEVLRLLSENSESTEKLAEIISGQLVEGVLIMVEQFGSMLALIARVTKGINNFRIANLGAEAIVLNINRHFTDMTLNINKANAAMQKLAGTFDASDQERLDGLLAQKAAQDAQLRNLARQSVELQRQNKELDGVIEDFENAKVQTDEIRLELQRLGETGVTVKLKRLDEEGNEIVEGDSIMSGGGDTGGGTGGGADTPVDDPAADFLSGIVEQSKEASKNFADLTAAMDTSSESEKLQQALQVLESQLASASVQATMLGVEASPEFEAFLQNVQNEIQATGQAYEAARAKESAAARQSTQAANERKAALEQEAQAAKLAKVEAIAGGAVGALQSGGASLLSAIPGVGGAMGGLLQMGQQAVGQAEQDTEANAREIAKERQDELSARREKMKKEGFTEEQLEAQGLSREDIAEAGVVTDEDRAQGEVTPEEALANQTKAMVTGIVEGFKAIIKGLPDILKILIPALLLDLPTAIMDSLPELIEMLIPILLYDLPKGLLMMLFNFVKRVFPLLGKLLFEVIPRGLAIAFDKIFKAIKKFFEDLFSFGFATGGYVSSTGMALVHQGERVIPASGAGDMTATRGLAAFAGGGSQTHVTINTATVDPDSVASLGRILDRELGALGRQSVPLFGTQAPVTEI